MAKHKRVWNNTVYSKYVREGRGQGMGADYKPWIVIQDFASKGMVSRVAGTTTGRVHHLMSNLELRLFYLLDWSDEVLDIREQYPLSDLSAAISVAERESIRYPYDTASGFPYVMTSDFYLETRQGTSVLSVKPSAELSKSRVREKLEIERRYWSERGIGWSVVTEHEINATKAANIEWLAQAKDLSVFGLSDYAQNACAEYFMEHYNDGRSTLADVLDEIESAFSLTAGMGLNIFKHLAYRKRIAFNTEERFEQYAPLLGCCCVGGAV
jgi:hypothetical protein